MVSNSNFQLTNLQTLNISNIRPPRLSNFQTLEVWKLQTFNPPKFETFRTFKLRSFQTFKLPGFQTFKLQALKLSNSNLKAARWTFALLLRATCIAAASNFKAGFLFKLSNSKLAPTFKLETLKLSNFKLFILQTFQTFKLSNLVQHVIRSNSQKFEFEKPHSWHLSYAGG